VPKTKWEAATALNLTPWTRMRRIIWPQAIALMIPSMNNLFIQLLKSTPLLYTITLVDLFNTGEAFSDAGGDIVVEYIVLSVIYFVLAYTITLLSGIAERFAKARLGQGGGISSVFRARRAPMSEAVPTR
jgi:polar amino acid transport system permease protein